MLRLTWVRLDEIKLDMTTLERVGVGKMVETRFRWFGHV
jgi:hypothetical protein